MSPKRSRHSMQRLESALALAAIALVIVASLRLGNVAWRQIILVTLFVPMIVLTVRHGQQPRRAAHRTLLHQATHDMLTGLPNRLLLRDRLHASVCRAMRDSSRFAVALVDLDGFKSVNDQHGHLAGDALLQAVAARLRDNLRAHDTVARFGGDEFVLILENFTDTAALVERCRQLGAVLAKPHSLTGRNGRFIAQINASIGIALAADHPLERLIQAADQALYQAKAIGKNCCVLAEVSIPSPEFEPAHPPASFGGVAASPRQHDRSSRA